MASHTVRILGPDGQPCLVVVGAVGELPARVTTAARIDPGVALAQRLAAEVSDE